MHAKLSKWKALHESLTTRRVARIAAKRWEGETARECASEYKRPCPHLQQKLLFRRLQAWATFWAESYAKFRLAGFGFHTLSKPARRDASRLYNETEQQSAYDTENW